MSDATDTASRWLSALLALPNAGVIGVWVFTITNEWYLYTKESVSVYSLTMCSGGPLSILGLTAGVIGLWAGRPVNRRWWWVCVAANGVGLLVNCAGFIGYMAD